jgi:hypothetical protein
MRAATLPDLRAHEDVVWCAGQHWSAPARRAAFPALAALVGLALALGAPSLAASWPAPWPFLGAAILATASALAVGRLIWIYLDWVDDALIVTTERVVWVQKTAFFNERRREIPVHHVENVGMAVDGLAARWLGYGDVLIEAAGAPPLAVAAIPRPQALQQRIFDVQIWGAAERKQREQAATDAALRGALGLSSATALPSPTGDVVIHLPAQATDRPTIAPEAAERPLVWRRHWWLLIADCFRAALLLALVGLVATLAPLTPGLRGELAWLLAAALFGLALIGLGMLLWAILAWREDRYVLDGDRLIGIDGAPFGLRREVKETSLARVQDVAYAIPHPLANLLNFGDVLVQTAGATQAFTFDGVADPRAVHAAISARLAAARAAETTGAQRQVRDDMTGLLQTYHRLAHSTRDEPRPDRAT